VSQKSDKPHPLRFAPIKAQQKKMMMKNSKKAAKWRRWTKRKILKNYSRDE
tara:strand:- start:627 stop:779 length:153 start_codon:yes stop_codon:yes gene_type:complete